MIDLHKLKTVAVNEDNKNDFVVINKSEVIKFVEMSKELARKTKALEKIKHQLEETGGLDDIEDRGEMLKWVNQALKVSDE